MGTDAKLLGLTVAHLVLTAAPGFAAVLFAIRRDVRSAPLLLAIGLAVSGATAMLAFWAYFAAPWIGRVAAYAILAGSLVVGFWCRDSLRRDKNLTAELTTPLLLWALGSMFVVFLGFSHGGSGQPIASAATRFSYPQLPQLPSDNDIPQFYASWYYEHGHADPPGYPGDWTSSDRPPLQVGYVLAQRTFGWDSTGLSYDLLGIVLQQLWIVGLWALLLAGRIRGPTRALAVIAVLVSDVGIVHGFFVWPKLLPAAFVLAALVLLAEPGEPLIRRRPWTFVLLAALAGPAYLGHGTSVFVFAPVLGLALWRGLPSWRWVGAGALAAILLLAPWSAYQRYFDPPANRLPKWMLAGDVPVDSRGTLTTIRAAYADAGFGGTVENKVQNLASMTGANGGIRETGDAVGDLGSGRFADAVGNLRDSRFFSLVLAMGLLVVAPFAMLVARIRGRPRGDEWRFSLLCFGIATTTCLVWGLLLFGSEPSRTTIHQGSLAIPILAIAGAVVGLRATFPRFADAVVALNVFTVLLIYVPQLDPPPGSSYSALALLLAALSLAGFCAVAFRGERAEMRSAVPAPAPQQLLGRT